MAAYYNENDPFAAAWLRELIKAKLIADGEVDERSIELVRPDDLRGFVQCHFFAGIGGWSEALRLAGWSDDRPVWTGSCPCQPFSVAGKGDGFADERHLWPAWHWLIEQRRPATIFGEQSPSPAGRRWLDLVSTDLEGLGYAIGPGVLPAACVKAAIERHRLWFVACADGGRRQTWGVSGPGEADERRQARSAIAGSEFAGELAGAESRGLGIDGRTSGRARHVDERQPIGVMGGAVGARLERHAGHGDDWNEPGRLGEDADRSTAAAGAIGGFWHPCDWLPCADGKARPVEPGTFPLAHGVPGRVGRLRGYGNAIVPQVAAAFIEAYREAIGETI